MFRIIEYNKFIRKIYITLKLTAEKINNVNKLEEQTDIPDKKSQIENQLYSLKKKDFRKNTKKLMLNENKKNRNVLSSEQSTKSKFKKFSFSGDKSGYKKENIFEKIITNAIKNKDLLKNQNEIKEFINKTDNELNSLEYNDAKLLDERSFCQYYFSLIFKFKF